MAQSNAQKLAQYVGAAITGDGKSGVITATKFVGDGSELEGVASAGLGTALSDSSTSDLNNIYYVNTTLSVGATITVDPPSSGPIAYTNYVEIEVADTCDLIIGNNKELLIDVLALPSSS